MERKNTSRNLFLEALLFAADFILTGFVTRYIWNNILVTMFGFRLITYWQGWGLTFILYWFFPLNTKTKERNKVQGLIGDICYTILFWGLMILFVGLGYF